MYDNVDPLNKLSNNLLLYKIDNTQEYLSKQVVIVGLGGTALEIIQQLGAIDFRNYILVDFDVIEETNLNRQFLFQKKDIGKLKTQVIKEYIEDNVKNANITIFNKRIKSKLDMQEVLTSVKEGDLIVCSADSPPVEIEKFLIEASFADNLAFITAGVGVYKGSVGPLLVDKKSKERYIEKINKVLARNVPSGVLKYSDGITNSYISLLLAKAVMDFLLKINKFPTNKVFIFKFDDIFKRGIRI